MIYLTHRRDDGQYQSLKAHITGVAERAAAFASAFGAEVHGLHAGLLHDIGKYSPAAQARQLDPEHTAKVDHATAGMQEALARGDLHGAFAVAGHHGGLPDAGSRASREDGTLMARANKPLEGALDASAWRTEIALPDGRLTPPWLAPKDGFANAMYTRMLFSCLVDADYLDTEHFMRCGTAERGGGEAIPALLARLRCHVAPWLAGATAPINAMRSDILRTCMGGGDQPRGLYSLTIPTGGGKTVSSLAFALSHAAAHGLSRVIYVIPYTSIIEQNAQVFRDILGAENVLEHHGSVDFGEDERLRLASENWDAPVVVTTAVQFFESLFAARTSRCRKLHSIANAVIIFDEAQMLPVPYLRPCVQAITELVQHYGATAILCTATQPSLDRLIAACAPGLVRREIGRDTARMYELFRRVSFAQEGVLDDAALATRLTDAQQTLCIVNSRKQAQRLYQLLPEAGRYHLSTLMTPDHRSCVLREIRVRLAAGETCRVVSTSLVEAGVDVDFPSVWREEAGLDAILQAAGRCNREGRRSAEESVVHVFCASPTPPRMFAPNVFAMRKATAEHADMASPGAIRTYFDQLMLSLGDRALDERQIIGKSVRMAFREVEADFRIIDDQTLPVYVPVPENAPLLDALRAGEIDRTLLRKLGRWAVNVYPQHFRALREAGALDCRAGEAYAILLDTRQYDASCGLALEPACGEMWFS